jgi:NADH dehydrogenase
VFTAKFEPAHGAAFKSRQGALCLCRKSDLPGASKAFDVMGVTLGNTAVVTVFGGSGFLGRYVVQALARAGCRIKVAVRRPDLAVHLRPLGGVGQIALIQANVRDEASVAEALRGSDAAVNLVGILQPSGRQKFKAVHAEAAGRIAKAARAQGARAMIQVSAIGANRLSNSAYARSKAEGEALVLEAFPGAVILRPSLIFGPEDNFFNRFAALAQISPIMPAIAGKTKMQPVYAGDVALAVKAALAGRAANGAVYELGGPTVFTFRELLKKICIWTAHRRPLVPVPVWLMKIPALVLELLPGAPITADQLRLLQHDNIVSEAATRDHRTLEGLGITEPRSVEIIVPKYLVRFRPHGEFSVDGGAS